MEGVQHNFRAFYGGGRGKGRGGEGARQTAGTKTQGGEQPGVRIRNQVEEEVEDNVAGA